MKKTHIYEPGSKPLPDFVIKSADEAFTFLLNDYKFSRLPTQLFIPEFWMTYRNEVTEVCVVYEYGGTPYVMMHQLERVRNEFIAGRRVGLDILIRARCPEKELARQFEYLEPTNDDLSEILQNYANALKNFGADILQGDFSDYPKFNRLTRTNERNINKEVFGSESGEAK